MRTTAEAATRTLHVSINLAVTRVHVTPITLVTDSAADVSDSRLTSNVALFAL